MVWKNTNNQFDLQRVYNYPINPRDSKKYSNKGFVNIDNGSQRGKHWTCFVMKGNKSYYFDSFGNEHDKFLLSQLPKPKIYHNYKTQNNSKLCGSYCLYFFYLIERMKCYDTILKIYFVVSQICLLTYLVIAQIILKIKLILLYLYKNHILELNTYKLKLEKILIRKINIEIKIF